MVFSFSRHQGNLLQKWSIGELIYVHDMFKTDMTFHCRVWKKHLRDDTKKIICVMYPYETNLFPGISESLNFIVIIGTGWIKNIYL